MVAEGAEGAEGVEGVGCHSSTHSTRLKILARSHLPTSCAGTQCSSDTLCKNRC